MVFKQFLTPLAKTKRERLHFGIDIFFKKNYNTKV
jgi:hypothetical protein